MNERRRPTSLANLHFEPANRAPTGWMEDDPRSVLLRGALREFMLPSLPMLQSEVVKLLFFDGLSVRSAALSLYARGLTEETWNPAQVFRVRNYAIRTLRTKVEEWANAARDDYTLARIAQAKHMGVKFDEVVRVDGGRSPDGLEGGDGGV